MLGRHQADPRPSLPAGQHHMRQIVGGEESMQKQEMSVPRSNSQAERCPGTLPALREVRPQQEAPKLSPDHIWR